MSQANIVSIEWFGDHDIICALRADLASFDQQAHACVAIACTFFINDATLLNPTLQLQTCPSNGLDSVNLGRQSALHVRGSSAIDTPIAHITSERRHCPALTHGNNVNMP